MTFKSKMNEFCSTETSGKLRSVSFTQHWVYSGPDIWHWPLCTDMALHSSNFVTHTHTQPRNKNKSWLENGTRPLPGGSCGARWIDSALSQKAGVSGSLSGCVRSWVMPGRMHPSMTQHGGLAPPLYHYHLKHTLLVGRHKEWSYAPT